MTHARPVRSRKPRWVPIAALIISITVAGIGAIGWTQSTASPSITLPDLDGNQVTLDADSALDPAFVARMNVTVDPAIRFAVPSAGLDVPLASMNEVEHTVTPPGFQDAYWIRNLGTSPSRPHAGTVFVAMHSLRGGGRAPGNYLIDVNRGTSSIAVGAVINVASSKYRVTSSLTVNKPDLPKYAAVWADAPDRLVAITCLQRPDGRPSTKNLVLIAEFTS